MAPVVFVRKVYGIPGEYVRNKYVLLIRTLQMFLSHFLKKSRLFKVLKTGFA